MVVLTHEVIESPHLEKLLLSVVSSPMYTLWAESNMPRFKFWNDCTKMSLLTLNISRLTPIKYQAESHKSSSSYLDLLVGQVALVPGQITHVREVQMVGHSIVPGKITFVLPSPINSVLNNSYSD